MTKLPSSWNNLSDEEKLENLKSKEVSSNVLKILAKSSNWEIRKAVAIHKNSPEEVIEELSNDEDIDVRDSTEFRRLSSEWNQVIENYQSDLVKSVQELVDKLKKDNVTADVLEIFAKSSNWKILKVVALHKNSSEKVLQQLSAYDDDNSDYIKDSILYRSLPSEWRNLDSSLSATYDEKLEKLNNDEDISPNVLEVFAKSNNPMIRDAVLRRRLPVEWSNFDSYFSEKKIEDENTPSFVLEILSQSSDSNVRCSVAAHKNTPEEVIQKLSKDENDSVRDTLLIRQLPNDWDKLDFFDILQKLEEDDNIPDNVLALLSKFNRSEICDAAKEIIQSTSNKDLTISKVDDLKSKRILYIKGGGFDWSNEYIDEDLYNQLNEEYSENYLDEDFIEEAGFDCESIDCEDSGPSFPPELVLVNEDTLEEINLTFNKSIEELGVKISGDYPIKEDSSDRNEDSSTSKDYRIHRVERFGGVWGAFYIEKGEIFDLSKINISVERKNCGDLQIDMCFLSYADQELDQDVCDLRGKYIEWHLSK